MSSINIPPAALEAGARALCAKAGYAWTVTPDVHAHWREQARAAFEAMVAAWDGAFKNRSGDYAMLRLSDAIILPVPMESLNDKA